MSIEVMTRVWKHSKMSGGALLVLLAISDCADDDGYAFPSYKTLAEKSRQDRRQVIRDVKRIVAAGELRIDERGGFEKKDDHFRNRANLYRVLVPGGSDKLSPPTEETAGGSGAGVTRVVTNSRGGSGAGVTTGSGPGVTPTVISTVIGTVIESSPGPDDDFSSKTTKTKTPTNRVASEEVVQCSRPLPGGRRMNMPRSAYLRHVQGANGIPGCEACQKAALKVAV